MGGLFLDASIRIHQALPYLLPRESTAPPINQPLKPGGVNVDSGFMNKIQGLLGVVNIVGWTIVGVSVVGVGGMMAWSWITGKGFQALGRFGWVVGGALVIGSGMGLVSSIAK